MLVDLNTKEPLIYPYVSEATRRDIVERFMPYLEKQIKAGVKLHAMTRHITGLYQGCPGARAWRRHLSVQAPKRPDDVSEVREALNFVDQERFADEPAA